MARISARRAFERTQTGAQDGAWVDGISARAQNRTTIPVRGSERCADSMIAVRIRVGKEMRRRKGVEVPLRSRRTTSAGAKILEKKLAKGGLSAEMPMEALRSSVKDVAAQACTTGGM